MTADETQGTPPAQPPSDFLRTLVADELRAGRYDSIVTRFPPEPNGYLHIGHATSIALNFGIAAETGGRCHLRFDDTNPETEDAHYVDSIIDTVRWLGYEWGDHLYFASDYFEEMYRFAEHLIEQGKAYVDSSSEEEIREGRGTVTEPGRASAYRERTVAENLDMFRRMRAGEFPNGAHVLRGKIDLASPNMLLRDPILYRIRHAHHYRTGDRWCIYPLYDYAHPIEDALECVTHSIATLEFENNRPLYDWVIENLPLQCRPRQFEFARRSVDYTVMSKRKLLALVRGGHVRGWDDPRMPTIAGLRRRGVTPEAIRRFCELVGVARTESRADIGKLEFAIRDSLNHESPRVLCVLRPLRVVLTNYPEGRTEELDAPLYPHDVPKEGSRPLPFTRELYIDRDDFHEDPPAGYHRLAPGREVRLRHAYIIRCDEVVRGEAGEVVELRCSYDPETRSRPGQSSRSVKGTIQWVSAGHSVPCEVRLYDRLFSVPDPDAGEEEFTTYLNPESLVVVEGARIEPGVADDPAGSRYQFERLGFFNSDPVDSTPGALVFNRTVTLRDTWARAAEPTAAPAPPGPRAGKAERAERPQGEPRRRPAPPAERAPELDALRDRLVAEDGLPPEDAEVITRDAAVAALYMDAERADLAPARSIANWIIHELPRELGERQLGEVSLDGERLARLVALVEEKAVSSSAGRQLLGEMLKSEESPDTLVERLGLRQVSDPAALEPAVVGVLERFPDKVAEFRGGKTGLRGFFVGQVMRETGGKANPELVGELLDRALADGGSAAG